MKDVQNRSSCNHEWGEDNGVLGLSSNLFVLNDPFRRTALEKDGARSRARPGSTWTGGWGKLLFVVQAHSEEAYGNFSGHLHVCQGAIDGDA
jgi:hypothetical protein